MSEGRAATETQQASARPRWSLERISALFAVTVSLVTLALLTVQTRLMQSQARAAVWPNVAIGFSSNAGGFAWVIANNGVGPARIDHVAVSLDGRPVRDWNALLEALGIERPAGYFTNQFSGTVLTPASSANEVYVVATLSPGPGATEMLAAVDRIAIDVCYCSIYDECHEASFRAPRPRAVRACPDDGAAAFQQ